MPCARCVRPAIAGLVPLRIRRLHVSPVCHHHASVACYPPVWLRQHRASARESVLLKLDKNDIFLHENTETKEVTGLWQKDLDDKDLREVSTGEDPESPSSTCTTSGSPMRPALGTYVWAWFELPAPVPRRSQLESIKQRRRNPIALARGWQRRLDTDEVASRAELARELGLTGHM